MTPITENIIYNGFVTLVAGYLFIFWTKKKALLNFRAWALLTTIINGVLTINWIFRWLNITNIKILMMLQFFTTVIILYRLWLLSEKYIPKQKMRKYNYNISKIIKSRVMAISHILKSGGNNNENTNKIRQKIIKSL